MKVFLSSASADAVLAEEISEILTSAGFQVWTHENILPGSSVDYELGRALAEADGVAFVVSPSWSKSAHTNIELAIAVSRKLRDPGLRLIPIKVHSHATMPALLARYQYVDISQGYNREQLSSELTAAFLSTPSLADAEDVFADEWSRHEWKEVAFQQFKLVEEAEATTNYQLLRQTLLSTLALASVAGAILAFNGFALLSELMLPLIALLSSAVGFYFGRGGRA